jgi:hypothetical protein
MINSTTETITVVENYSLFSLIIKKTEDGYEANVSILVTDSNGDALRTIDSCYKGEEYNQWWDNFNSWKIVLDRMKDEHSLPITIPTDIDNQITNP